MTEIKHPAGHELQAFLDKELGPADAERVAEHCERCATCRAELTELRRMQDLLAAVPVPELSRTVWHRVAMARRQEGPLARIFKVALAATCASGIVLGLQLGPVQFSAETPTAGQPAIALESIWGDGSSASLLSVYTTEED